MRTWNLLLAAGAMLLPGALTSAYAETVCTSVLSVKTLNYGRLARSDITASRQMENGQADAITTKKTLLTVNCSQPTRLRLYFAGNHNEKALFSFGPAAAFRMAADHANVDGQTVQLLSHPLDESAKITDSAMQQSIKPGNQLLFIQNGESKGTAFSVRLTVQPLLAHTLFSVADKTVLQSTVNIIAEAQD
ncbi:hypothetical protein AHX05_07325 [Salmonella enterica subsp. indica]|uniref:DUF1120 domain-containing protein n=4 Tax=Salmonella enterica TaxID=28901 RepID=A0A5Y2QPB5_SALER|nr:hypothetical protein [Salmonella enterica]EBP3211119.1 hypothetical protein [Salmonella enterica subsp. arizonae]ECI8272461.1 hypothetical protein [Salmonella enterica subsp. enterica]EDR2771971.1 hypothetical protein [Salmonella enterica subsp. enterica serovar Oslo]EEC4250165.1 hypothetical protein [Salmonella enterica subsp. diarizonae]EEM2503503.1 hypothetical protein [Salmonella enterica subsp. indica serovar 45:a:e,n,x]HAE8196797.1 hypothetical protein [Salmonella enterica subsp. ind